MNPFRWLEAKLFLGEVLHDYGVIDQTTTWIMRTRVSVLLCRRKGETAFVIKESNVAWLGFSIRYTPLRRSSLVSLKQAVDDALMRAA